MPLTSQALAARGYTQHGVDFLWLSISYLPGGVPGEWTTDNPAPTWGAKHRTAPPAHAPGHRPRATEDSRFWYM